MDDDVHETREVRRRTVLLAGAVVYNRQHFPCRVRNISVSGMQVEIDVPLAPGTPVHADLPRYGRFPAVVAWIEGRMMGLVFPEGAAGGLARFGEAAVRLGLIDPPATETATPDARVAPLSPRR
ncbi:MAG: PilZ domain-containing protein [Sphingomonadaceae bacterium]|nr:PilZ domain-containing protein [Sphingomonadaceae bacterium]